MKRVVERVKAILRGDEDGHHMCPACRLEVCSGAPGCCPPERKGIAVTAHPNVYIHPGTCMRRYIADPGIVTRRLKYN